ncbi:MAG: hypothetical protein AB2L22_12905 [Syntrophales bacterium]
MKAYDSRRTYIGYHPDKKPELFLPADLTECILSSLKAYACSQRDRDTLDFIHRHEESQRHVAEGIMTRTEQRNLLNGMVLAHLGRHGNLIHAANPLYHRFYKTVQSS